jgi:biuret amidohydrolase
MPNHAQIPSANSALLIIDMQRDFCSPGGYADRAGLDINPLRDIIPNIRNLRAAARAAGLLTIFTREGHLPDLSDCPAQKLARSKQAGAEIGAAGPLGKLLVRGEYGQDIIDELAPSGDDVVIDKPGYSAFPGTALALVLAENKIRQLFLCGVTTEVCVHSTLRDAIDRGFYCITIADSCASGYPHLHAAAIEMIGVEGGIFGEVWNTATVIECLR